MRQIWYAYTAHSSSEGVWSRHNSIFLRLRGLSQPGYADVRCVTSTPSLEPAETLSRYAQETGADQYQKANQSRGITFTMSSFLHYRRVRKAKSNTTSKLAVAIVVSLVVVLLLISVALWFWGRRRTKHRAQQVIETRDKRPGVDSLWDCVI
jgi:hypothetical protein